MRTRLRLAMLVPIILFLAAACQDFAGLEELDRSSQHLVQQGVVADVVCPDTLLTGMTAQCTALNAQRTKLIFGGYPFVPGGWESRGPQIVSVSLDGTVLGESPGVIWILARGTLGSVDSARVVVPTP